MDQSAFGGQRVAESSYVCPAHTDVEIVTDASPWEIGGVLRVGGAPAEVFFSNLPG